MQIIEERTGGDHSTSDMLLYLEIDTRLRMAELGKHFGDLESAKNDFTTVIKLCERYPLRNEQTLTSAMFALGKIHLDQQQVKDAKVWFIRAIDILT